MGRTFKKQDLYTHQPAEPEQPLPPPGDARRETLSRRKDALEAEAERLNEATEGAAIDPKAFEIDPEIARHVNPIRVSRPQPGYRYCWANYASQHGWQVRAKSTLGWEVVTGDMVEAREHKAVDGTRRIGDVLLMRIPETRFAALERREEQNRLRRHVAVDAEVREIAARHGINVRSDPNDPIFQRYMKRHGARALARERFTTMLREGTVPGMPPPQK